MPETPVSRGRKPSAETLALRDKVLPFIEKDPGMSLADLKQYPEFAGLYTRGSQAARLATAFKLAGGKPAEKEAAAAPSAEFADGAAMPSDAPAEAPKPRRRAKAQPEKEAEPKLDLAEALLSNPIFEKALRRMIKQELVALIKRG